jgi:UrcA family protein
MKVLDILSTVGALVLATTPLAVAGVAHAQTGASVAIQVGDLDFGSRADVARFQARIVMAADRLCDAGPTEISRRSACIAAVREEAMDKLGSAQRSEMIATAHKTPGWSVASAE